MRRSTLLWVVGIFGWTTLAALAATGGGRTAPRRPPAARPAPPPPRSKPAPPPPLGPVEELFETKVRPVLFAQCLGCHGETRQTAGLRLDSREAMLKGGQRGPAIVPGKPDDSLLVRAIRHVGDVRMPPGQRLKPEEIEAIAAWIAAGAPWPAAPQAANAGPVTPLHRRHWAFQPIRRVAPPPVRNRAWVRNEIDRFILAELEKRGLSPAPPADRRTLIRRATLDLTGLPPTPQEVAAFLADRSPDAWEKVIDRLLASPQYGERWARHWLDVARYASTKGYVFTDERTYPFAYTYRDWVIRAFNEDLPYDQFIIQQIAADHLDLGSDNRALAAMGFLTVGRRFLNNIHDIIDDRIDVVTRGFLGLTVTCARCHDHKYDPIPTADYYSLYGVFASSVEPPQGPPLAQPEPTPAYLEFQRELRAREAERDRFVADTIQRYRDQARRRVGDYLLAAQEVGANPTVDRFVASSQAPDLAPAIVARWHQQVTAARDRFDPVLAPWVAFAALPAERFAAEAPGVLRRLIEPATAGGTLNPRVAQAFAGSPPRSLREVADRYNTLFAEASGAAEPTPEQEPLRRMLAGALTVTDEEIRRGFNRAVRDRIRSLENAIQRVRATHPGAPPHAMVLVDAPEPVEPRIFVRGNPNNPGEKVPRQFLLILAGENRKPFQKGSGRLELAQAIASRGNPLTARVFVNRVWMHHFGYGLVRTPSDFGMRSEPPSHPELLDYLAARFMDEGWSIKRLHRLIMLSATYQQSSAHDNPRARRIDPENRLLWRMNRRPLELEAMRDSLLAVAGRLDLTMGGRDVDLLRQPFSTRRTIYGFIDRQNLQGFFRVFNLASPDAHSPQRYHTTIPQQALYFMNSPFVVEQARALAARPEVAQQSDPAARIRALYEICFGRPPTAEELRLGLEFVRQAEAEAAGSPAVWEYGYGAVDPASRRVQFTPLPHFAGEAWQMGEAFPHPQLGHLRLTATGGHPGNDGAHAAIRRWRAPADGKVSIRATLAHSSERGDGVRGLIVSSRAGVLGEWVVHNQQVTTDLDSVPVRRGETIDFVVEPRGGAEFDSFTWEPAVRLEMPSQEGRANVLNWSARADFGGPAPEPLTAWQKYAHVLLMTNEFYFID